jgi:ABC-type nitrate/sulfonate/bicarbonate transport system substrate-binding protein
MPLLRIAPGRAGVTLVAAVSVALSISLASITAQAQELTKLRITNFTNIVVGPIFYGVEKGWFKEAGIDIEIVKVATGAASVSAVAANQADIGWAAATVPMFARSQGVPVKIFMTADQEGPPDHFGTHFDATAKSGINTFADVKGKTVMINAFGTAGELAIRERLMDAGVSWDDVKKVVVPFPQMPAALELGNADVAVTIYPMQAAIMANKAIGAKLLGRGNIMASSKQVVTASCYFATDTWLAKNQKAALAFGRVYARAQKEIDADPKMRLGLWMKLSGMKKEVAETIPAPWFQSLPVTKETVGPIYDALLRTGMMAKSFPLEDMVATLPF